jgi:uncharacterized membrane protein YdbT with pleckstrin-like domain
MPHEIHHTRNPFSAFAEAPVNVTFDSQETGEKIILLLRQHVIVLVLPILAIILMILAPILIGALTVFTGFNLGSILTETQLMIIIVFWYLFIFAFALYKFIFWYFNIYILTNERIIDYDFRGILHKQTSFAKLGQIQDVTPKMIGFFSTFFNYGDIYVQKAGERQEFDFHKVPKPAEVSNRILEEVRLEEAESPGKIE